MKKSLLFFMAIIMIVSCTMPAFASSAIAPQTSDELLLCDFWISKNSEIRPFGETRTPDDVFIADIDNDKAPELVVFYSYLGPGGPAFAIYKNDNGTVVHDGNIITDSGTGIHHNLCLVTDDKGDIRILDHYTGYPLGELAEQKLLLSCYDSGNTIPEKYVEVQYLDKVYYTTEIGGENRVYCTREEADTFFKEVYGTLGANVVFSSESEEKQSNDFFGIWTKQTEKRNVITVLIDGKKVEFDQKPVIVDNRTLVPLRAIFEELGAAVIWEADTRTALSIKGDTAVSVTEGKNTLIKNGEVIELDVAPRIIGSRTLVPVRAVAESFDCKVEWEAETKTVIITTK